MTDTEIEANLYAFEQRVYELEQKIKHMADVGDMVEVEQHLYGDMYEIKNVKIKHIAKRWENEN